MNTLFGRTFLGIAAALVLLSVIIGLFVYVGLQRSVSVWNVNRTRHLQSTVSQELLRIARQEGDLHEVRLSAALERFLTPGVSLVILSPEQEPVFLYERGLRLDLTDAGQVGAILEELGRSRNPALAVFDQDRIVGYLSVDTLGFRSDLSNRMFINSMIVSIALAILLSLVLALSMALLISRQLTGQARSLAVGLTDLARGNRSVEFSRRGAEELRTIADAARALQGQLIRGEQLRNQWMQDIAHDLRTPITALSSQLEGMIEGVLQPSRTRLQSVHQELQRVEELVRDLRELSRVESPEFTLEREVLRIDHLVETALGRLRHREDARNTSWVTNLEPVEVNGDKSLLLRSITNVLENALVHGEEGREIVVEMRSAGRTARLSVVNYGQIPEKHLPHLFDRLFRGDRGRSSPGSGLGLAITQAILERHEGSISIRQQSDQVVAVIELPGHHHSGSVA